MAAFTGILRASFGILLCCLLLTGIVYPLVVTGITQLLFPTASNGSLVEYEGKVVGSELLGQEFTRPEYFWGRPSATTPPYNATASAGSNLSPANPVLHSLIKDRIKRYQQADPKNEAPIPVDLLTASASGLDPHISMEGAEYQIPRVARHRKISEDEVRRIVWEHTENPFLGMIGRPHVNVLMVNMLLDEVQKK